MKKSIQLFFAAATILISSKGMAQSANETSAALEYQKVGKAIASGDMDGAKKALVKAKEYIDLAAANEKTKDSPKTLFYKGEIYSSILMVGQQSMDTNFVKIGGDDPFKTAIDSYKRSFEISDKYDSDIKDAIAQKKAFLDQFSVVLFQQKAYKEAVELFDAQAQLSSVIGKIDTTAIYNAGIAAENAGDFDLAVKYYKQAADYGYKVPEIYKSIGLALTRGGKSQEAADFFKQAIEKSPNDPTLYFYLGTMYIDLKDEENAALNLKKAIELNPKYSEAQYQLGKNYLDIATRLNDEANALPASEQKQYTILSTKANSNYREAAGPLEKYMELNPKDKAVAQTLVSIHRRLGNTAKVDEWKAKIAAM